MTPHRDKARNWQRIETAAQLAARLRGVRPRRWRNYQFVADPPCHDSRSRISFQFGDHPRGGLTVTCWACQTPGAGGWLNRLEDILGAALQVRYENGALRYSEETDRPQPPPRPPKSAPAGNPPALYPAQATVADLMRAPMWLAVRGRMPWQGVAPERGRLVRQAWRQSMEDAGAPDGDGLKLARYGGLTQGDNPQGETGVIRIRPWAPLCEIERFIAGLPPAQQVRPALALAGSAAYPSPLGLLAIDCDYEPAEDETGQAGAMRDRLRRDCAAAGAPVYGSSGGHGFHALFLLEAERPPLHRRQNKQTPVTLRGLAAETFLSGAGKMLTVRLDRPLANAEDGRRLPRTTARQAAELVRRALRERG